MKLKMYLALLAMGMLSLQGCNDDDDDLPNSKVPEAVRNAFDSSFSNTANLSWETKTVSQGQYYKAEFNNKSDNGYKTEVSLYGISVSVMYHEPSAVYQTSVLYPLSLLLLNSAL